MVGSPPLTASHGLGHLNTVRPSRGNQETAQINKESGKEVPFSTLASTLEFDNEVTSLFLAIPIQRLEDSQHFFTGGRHIKEFLIAELGPALISHPEQSSKVKDAWHASNSLMHRAAQASEGPTG